MIELRKYFCIFSSIMDIRNAKKNKYMNSLVTKAATITNLYNLNSEYPTVGKDKKQILY